MLLVEQNLAVARRLAHDVIVLDQGRVVYTGTMRALIEDEALTRHYLGVAATAGGVGGVDGVRGHP